VCKKCLFVHVSVLSRKASVKRNPRCRVGRQYSVMMSPSVMTSSIYNKREGVSSWSSRPSPTNPRVNEVLMRGRERNKALRSVLHSKNEDGGHGVKARSRVLERGVHKKTRKQDEWRFNELNAENRRSGTQRKARKTRSSGEQAHTKQAQTKKI
jgi:hypothetical protein